MLAHPFDSVNLFNQFRTARRNYLEFVRTLTGANLEECKSTKPNGFTLKQLDSTFRNSLFPQNKQTPVDLWEAWSLYTICRLQSPLFVVETGVSAGRSTAFILAAMHDSNKGQLFSFDPDSNSGYAVPDKLKDRWCLIAEKSHTGLRTILSRLGTIDLFLHDSPHTYENMMFEFH
ncbi:MAG: class I SAM-dependent methyltransferase [Nitrososphaerales archaeon]